MAVFPLIPFAVNLPAYATAVGAGFSPAKELTALGFANLFSALSFYPTYLNCSGSILFNMCGSNSRAYSLVAGLAMLPLYFMLHRIVVILPTFVISAITQFVGISFLVGYAPTYYRASRIDKLCMAAMLVAILCTGGGVMLLIGLAAASNVCLSYLYSGTLLPAAGIVEAAEDDSQVLFLVRRKLNFYNVSAVTSRLGCPAKNVVVDLTDCLYVDITANLALRSCLEAVRSRGHSYSIVHRPGNFYHWLYAEADLACNPLLS